MRSATFLAGLGLALAAASAVAAEPPPPPAPINFPVTGNTPEICAVQSPVLTGGGQLINFLSLNGTMLQIDQLADPRTLTTVAAAADVTFPTVCNFPHRVVIQSQNNGLWRGGAIASPPPSGFADGVPYTVNLTWGPTTDTFFVDATSRQTTQHSVAVGQPRAGDILLHLAIQAGASNLTANAPLIEGVYSDTLLVTVEPQ
jgi:hypothetical protein